MNATHTTARAPAAGDKERSATGRFLPLNKRMGRLRFIVQALSIIYASLAAFLLLGLLLTLDAAPPVDEGGTTAALGVLLTTLFLLSGLALGVPRARRLHDLDLSGWWALAGLVPLLHLPLDIALAVVPGNKPANRYGPPPAASGAGTFIALAALAVILVALVAAGRWFMLDQQQADLSSFDEADCSSALAGGAASPECRAAADGGYAEAQYALGIMYEFGQAVERDDAAAVTWYRKAAAQGLATAQNSLGIMYDQGWGVAQDDGQAVKWYHLAALQGLADAQKSLGLMYAEGRGVDTNLREAAAWFQLAAAQGNPVAQYRLGLLYGEGRGVECSHAESRRWIRRAAEQGLADAQRQVG
ncbi:MAG TPA: DUF805 domain-containing protein, partial [Halomonas sp.]|nr:DUF805 domain-containing protein [Halomonas sp.]